MSAERSVFYGEIQGSIDRPTQRSIASDAVVVSNLRRANVLSAGKPGICVRYVARGRETYRIGGRGMHLEPGQVMVVSEDLESEVEIIERGPLGTLGLCVHLLPDDDLSWVAGPILTGAQCIAFGPAMERRLKTFLRPNPHKEQIAADLVRELRATMPFVARTVLDQAASIDAAKPSTRFEMVRRANFARGYLHSVLDRAVTLDELASAVATSRFQLLRGFQSCFGETPAEYHRRLRLNAVVEDARRRAIPLGMAAQDFGFADVSSFSHAYRRCFGHAPVRSKAEPQEGMQFRSAGREGH